MNGIDIGLHARDRRVASTLAQTMMGPRVNILTESLYSMYGSWMVPGHNRNVEWVVGHVVVPRRLCKRLNGWMLVWFKVILFYFI
jgi:hypothetical protein